MSNLQESISGVENTTFVRGGFTIEIVGEITAIENGLQVFAKAWKNGKRVGFGDDGTVEIERFRIFNLSTLVRDDAGDIVKVMDDVDGGTLEVRFRDDPEETIKKSISEIIAVVEKDDSKIVDGKIGNTTDTFYSSTNDGCFLSDNQATYSLARDAVTASSIDQGNGNLIHNSKLGSTYYVRRFVTYFDTSSISSNTISSATLSVASLSGGTSNANSDSIAVVSFGGSNPPVITDFDDFGSTSGGSLLIGDFFSTDGIYNNFTLNSYGLSLINKTGTTALGLRSLNDINNSAPTGDNHIRIYQADQTGTSLDPKLIVVHSAAASTIQFDAASEGHTTANSTTLTVSHTCTGSDRILFVNVMCSSARTISSVTYNGVTMTNINRSGGGQPCALYYLIAPATGANNIVVTIDSSSYIYICAGSYTGVKQTSPIDGNSTNSSTSSTVTTSITTTNDKCWSILGARNGTAGQVSGTTNCTTRVVGTGYVQLFDSGGEISTGAFSMSLNNPNTNTIETVMATFIPVAAAGGSPTDKFFSMFP